MQRKLKGLVTGLALSASLFAPAAVSADRELLNASYDVARELFAAYNVHFNEYWKEKTGDSVESASRTQVLPGRHKQLSKA